MIPLGLGQTVLGSNAPPDTPIPEPVAPVANDMVRQLMNERKIAAKSKKGGRLSTVLSNTGSNQLG